MSIEVIRCPDCGEIVNNFFDHVTGCEDYEED